MTAAEAKKIIELANDPNAYLPIIRSQAIGYLEALEGPEVKELVEALETIIQTWTNGTLGAQEVFDCKKALVQYREAMKK